MGEEILMTLSSYYPEDGGSKALRYLISVYEVVCRYIKEDCNLHSITLLKYEFTILNDSKPQKYFGTEKVCYVLFCCFIPHGL